MSDNAEASKNFHLGMGDWVVTCLAWKARSAYCGVEL